MEITRGARYLASSEVLWAMLSSPESLLWLVGLDDTLPGWSDPVPAWLQEPTAFEAPLQHVLPVTFEDGPLTDATIAVVLDDQGEKGVQVDVTLTFATRRSWTEFLTTPRLVKHLEARLERQLADLEAALRGRNQFLPAPPPPTEAARKRILEAFQDTPPPSRAAVVDRLLRAPLPVQSVLRPAEIAAQDALPIADVLATLIAGVQHGVLELEWAVLCPQSRNAEEDGKRIHQDGMHCAACGVRFATGLHDSMELVFRPRTAIRPERVDIQRLMRGRSPVPVGKQRIDLRQSLEFTLELEAGRYLLESESGSLVVDVATEHTPQRIVRMTLGRTAPAHSARLPPGRQRFEIVNPLTHVVRLQISRRWRPPFPFTAATLYDFPPTREMLPSALLAPECEVLYGAVMLVDADDANTRARVQAVLRALIPAEAITRNGNRVIAVIRSLPAALDAAEQMAARQLLVGVGIGIGIIDLIKREVAGQARELAAEALALAGPPQFAVHEDSLDALLPAIEEHGRAINLRERPGKPALMVFAAVVDGAPELEIEEVTPTSVPGREFAPLTHIAGCTVIGSLDKGGVGEVFEVERDETGERLAVKVLHPHLTSKRFIQLFNKECYYATQLAHPNIVTSHDWGEEDGRPFLLMERMHGRTLYQAVKGDGPLGLAATARVLSAILAALGAIHEQGLVHRDIKPHNVFLLDDPDAAPHGTKILDFGLMRPAGFSKDERFAGTPEFMAPEQLEMGHVDARTDVYAVAALAFYIRTGRPPFKGRTRGEGAVLRMDGLLPEELDAEILGPLLPVVVKGLAFDPRERWPDAAAMREGIDHVLDTLDPKP